MKDLLFYGFSNPVKRKVKMETVELPKIDVTKYVGIKATIVKAEVIKTKFGMAIRCESNPIPFKDKDTLPEGKQLRGSIILGLVQKEDGTYAIGKDTKTEKFCKEHKIDIAKIPDVIAQEEMIREFEGKSVVLQKSANGYLTLA